MLHKNGIGGILDYAAEDDMDADEGPASRTGPHEKVVARTFDYGSEEVCDGHMRVFMKSIEAAADAPGRGFAAIKVSQNCSFGSDIWTCRQGDPCLAWVRCALLLVPCLRLSSASSSQPHCRGSTDCVCMHCVSTVADVSCEALCLQKSVGKWLCVVVFGACGKIWRCAFADHCTGQPQVAGACCCWSDRHS